MGAPGAAARASGFGARRDALAAEAERDAKLPKQPDIATMTGRQLWHHIENRKVPAHHRVAAASVWDAEHAHKWDGDQPRSGAGRKLRAKMQTV